MWIMVITFLFYGDPVTGNFVPEIGSVEFRTKKSCEAAKTAYLSSLQNVTDQINRAIEDELKVGELKGPNGLILSAVCFEK